MLKPKGPAIAGLFFALSTTFAAAAEIHPLPVPAQLYFRRFVELFTPAVLNKEKNSSRAAANYRWDRKNRDCAGLVRYLFWEAMQSHNENFYAAYPVMRQLPAADLPRSLAAVQSAWADGNLNAAELIAHGRYLGREFAPRTLKTGDVLYFQSAELKIRHVMLVVRSGAQAYLVYHTGDKRDELRIRTLADILMLPEAEWHPEAANPVFKGIYRPKFLD